MSSKGSSFKKRMPYVALAVCTFAVGCGQTIARSTESRSPDGKMVASARTIVPSGMGTGEAQTEVDLNWTSGSQRSTAILILADGMDQPGVDKTVGLNWL